MKRLLIIGVGLASAFSLAAPPSASRSLFRPSNPTVQVANDEVALVQPAASNVAALVLPGNTLPPSSVLKVSPTSKSDDAFHLSGDGQFAPAKIFQQPPGGRFTPGSVQHDLEAVASASPLLRDVPSMHTELQDAVDALPALDSAIPASAAPVADAALGSDGREQDRAGIDRSESIENPAGQGNFAAREQSAPNVGGAARASEGKTMSPALTRAADSPNHDDPLLSQLPSLGGAQANAPATDAVPEANLVLFGREMVELRVSEGWSVTEAAAGRDVRLVLTPDAYREKLERGMWLACHVLLGAKEPEALESLLTQRIAAITKQQAKAISTGAFSIDSWPGVRAEFELEAPVIGAEPQRYRGFHFLVSTPWAMVEGHGVAASGDQDVMAALRAIQDSIQLQAPKKRPTKMTDETLDALPVVGVWKSSAGRMRIHDSGRIDMESDKLLLLDTPATHQEAARLERIGPPRLRGTYRATGDVLRITWNDGSQLNLRWKLSHGKMLVTDHLGKISKLKPLLE